MSERYELIDAEHEQNIDESVAAAPTIGQMCRWLSVSRSGYYEWRARPESNTARRRAELTIKIGVLFDLFEGTFRFWEEEVRPALATVGAGR